MKRVLSLLLVTALAVGCGVAGGPGTNAPAVSTGNLLLTPLQVPIAGVRVRAEALPLVSVGTSAGRCEAASECHSFMVPVRLQAASALPPLRVTGVYVVTENGVWRSGVQPRDNRLCPDPRCLVATARGNADISSGEAVQVVVTLKDAQGRSYRLRDQHATVQAAP